MKIKWAVCKKEDAAGLKADLCGAYRVDQHAPHDCASVSPVVEIPNINQLID